MIIFLSTLFLTRSLRFFSIATILLECFFQPYQCFSSVVQRNESKIVFIIILVLFEVITLRVNVYMYIFLYT